MSVVRIGPRPSDRIMDVVEDAGGEKNIQAGTAAAQKIGQIIFESIRNGELDVNILPLGSLIQSENQRLSPALAGLYSSWEVRGYPFTVNLASDFLRQYGFGQGSQWFQVSEDIRQLTTRPQETRKSSAETLVNAVILMALAESMDDTPLEDSDIAKAIIAISSKDVDFSKSPYPHLSIDTFKPHSVEEVLSKHRVSSRDIEDVRTLMSAMNPENRTGIMELNRGETARLSPSMELAKENITLATLSAIVSDATWLSLVGLTGEHTERVINRVEFEIERQLSQEDLEAILFKGFGGFASEPARRSFSINADNVLSDLLGEDASLLFEGTEVDQAPSPAR